MAVLSSAIVAVGKPDCIKRNDPVRLNQMMILEEQPETEVVPAPRGTVVGDDLWREWFKNLDEGITLSESARAYRKAERKRQRME